MDQPERGTIRVGVGGWIYEPWRGTFYPEGLAQKRRARVRQPQADGDRDQRHLLPHARGRRPSRAGTTRRPTAFVFALKAPRYATTRRELATAGESIDRFCTGASLALKDKLGPINWQLAPTKKLDLDDLAALLGALPQSVEGRHAAPRASKSATRASATRSSRTRPRARGRHRGRGQFRASPHRRAHRAFRLRPHHGHLRGRASRLLRCRPRPLGRQWARGETPGRRSLSPATCSCS